MTSFSGTIKRSDILSILSAVTVLGDVGRVLFDDNKLRLRCTDPAGVAIVVVDISPQAFEEVTIGSSNICLDFSELTDMIDAAGEEADVELELDGYDLSIHMMDLQFTETLLDPAALDRDREKPDVTLDTEIVIDSSSLDRGIKAADLVADHVEFGIDEDKSEFYMEAKGDTNEVILKKGKKDLVTLTAKEVSSTFSVDYLKAISNAIPDDIDVRLLLGDEYPTEISYTTLDDSVEVTYFLSPRIQPDT